MPKIKNDFYKQFQDGFIDIIEKPQFEKWLNEIENKKLPRKCTIEQARALYLAVFYLGRRPSEIADIKGNTVEKVKDGHSFLYRFNIKTLKNGKQVPVTRPVNKFTTELYNYIRNRPPEMYAFWAFRKENKNKVKWISKKEILVKETFADGTNKLTREPFIENKSKIYIRKGGLINYYITLWTGRPAYWFRHHRYSAMYSEGGTDVEVQLDKGAKNPASINAYKHMSKKIAKNIVKTFKY